MASSDVPKFRLIKFRTAVRNERGPSAAVNEVLDSQDELDDYVASCQDKQPITSVKFPDERAVAVALGSRPQIGYSVEIIAVVQETGGFVGVQHHVLYVERTPHGPSGDLVTFPQHVIRVRGLSGIVSFRQVPDELGHSLRALVGAATDPTPAPAPGPVPPVPPVPPSNGNARVGGPLPPVTSLYVGEEHHVTSLFVGEESHTMHIGEHPTTLMLGEEHHLTSLYVGEEGPPHPFGDGGGGGRGPFG